MEYNNFPVPVSNFTGLSKSSFNQFNNVRSEENRTRRILRRPQRTSTPVNCSVSPSVTDTSESFSDSVSELFYQSWKNELDNFDHVKPANQFPERGNIIHNVNYYLVNNNFNSIWYPNQMVFFNTVIPCTSPSVAYYPAVGYRSDGTYGVIPGMWYCYYR